MKRIALLFAAGLTVVGVAVTMSPAHADDCANSSLSTKQFYPTLGLGQTTGGALSIGDGTKGIYIDDRGVDDNGQWIYLESNGVFGLQRGGTSPAGDTDGCNDGGTPDTLLF